MAACIETTFLFGNSTKTTSFFEWLHRFTSFFAGKRKTTLYPESCTHSLMIATLSNKSGRSMLIYSNAFTSTVYQKHHLAINSMIFLFRFLDLLDAFMCTYLFLVIINNEEQWRILTASSSLYFPDSPLGAQLSCKGHGDHSRQPSGCHSNNQTM